MAQHSGRMGRRRRVLNEEVLAASALGIAARGHEDPADIPGDTPRYGAGANIENHPQITDYVPRRFRVIALVMMAGVALGAGGELIANYAVALSERFTVASPEEITATLTNGLLAWTSAVALLVAACYARIIHSLRRHRVDDDRGRYRVWRWASWAAVLLSLNAVVGAHLILGRVMGHLSGWSLLPNGAGWWLVPAALLGGWLLMRLTLDAAECRTAFTTFSLAMVCFVAAGVALCWTPTWIGPWHETVCRLLPLGGHILLTIGTLLFARYVVLDVQGLIEHRPSRKPASATVLAIADDPYEPTADQQSSSSQASSAGAEAHDDQSMWVDGSQPEDRSTPETGRRLSKAERKRHRKQKARKRAA